MRLCIGVGAAVAAVCMAAPAAAVSVVAAKCVSVASANGCLFDGNTGPNTVAATQAAYNGYNDTVPSARPDIRLNYLFKSDDADFGEFGSLQRSARRTSGTWSIPGYKIDYIAVKAGPNFVLYRLAQRAQAGTWNTFDIPYARNPRELSHVAFFGAAVPEPATWAMLISGFGLVGVAARRRRQTQVLA